MPRLLRRAQSFDLSRLALHLHIRHSMPHHPIFSSIATLFTQTRGIFYLFSHQKHHIFLPKRNSARYSSIQSSPTPKHPSMVANRYKLPRNITFDPSHRLRTGGEDPKNLVDHLPRFICILHHCHLLTS